MDAINLKISKVGGLTKAREIRDLCISAGVAMTMEDSWGGDIVTAAIAHLARSTPEEGDSCKILILFGAPTLGKDEVRSSILRGGTSFSPKNQTLIV